MEDNNDIYDDEIWREIHDMKMAEVVQYNNNRKAYYERVRQWREEDRKHPLLERKTFPKKKHRRIRLGDLNRIAIQERRDKTKQENKIKKLEKERHDVHGKYKVVVTLNKKEHTVIGEFEWKQEAEHAFDDIVNENKYIKTTIPYKAVENDEVAPVGYQILLLEDKENYYDYECHATAVLKDEILGTVSRNFVDNAIRHYIIIRKATLNVEETFHVTGTDEEVNVNQIVIRYVLPMLNGKGVVVSIGAWQNMVVICGDDDIIFIECRHIDIRDALYYTLRYQLAKKKFVLFIGDVPDILLPRIEEVYKEKNYE